jgi:hypothetical protein
MPPSFFISYSRRETPFVDSLLDAIEDHGYDAWLDYQDMVPGRPWQEQIVDAIRRADIFLLVVSYESMISKNVQLEYEEAIATGKRILLLIFQAQPLPEALHGREWIDFRTSFEPAFDRLLAQVEKPAAVDGQPPQKGFEAPPVVWWAILASLLAVVVSIPAWWSLYLPVVLVPLPIRILRRDFRYARVQAALVILPLILFLTLVFFMTYDQVIDILMAFWLVSFVPVVGLFAMLRSRRMHRWGKPIAAPNHFANPYQPDPRKPEPVTFTVDYAAQDKKYADELIRGLKRSGHLYVTEPEKAQAAFVLISAYKNSTDLEMERQVVYPVILQDTVIEDDNLLRIQWIDFRRGLRYVDRLAQLLPEPSRLLKALGVPPTANQAALPTIVRVLEFFLTIQAIFAISVWLPLFLELGPQFLQSSAAIWLTVSNVVLALAIVGVCHATRVALIRRRGGAASLFGLVVSFVALGGLVAAQFLAALLGIVTAIDEVERVMVQNDLRGSVTAFVPIVYLLGMLVLVPLGLWFWKDLNRWFPFRGKVKVQA